MVKCSGVDIVEANYRDIEGHAQSKILQCAYGTDRRHIVKGDYRCKARSGGQEVLHHRIAQLRGVNVALKLHTEFWVDWKAHLPRHFNETAPAFVGIRTERLPAHEDDPAMSQGIKVRQRKFRCPPVVQQYIGDASD